MKPFFANLPPAPANARIAVIRLCDAVGLLCAVPALRALRAAAPGAHIALVGLPAAAQTARRFSAYISEFIAANDQDLAKDAYDIVIQLQAPAAEVTTLTARLRPKWVAGFYSGAPNGSHTTGSFHEWPESGPEVLRLLTLIRGIGVRDLGDSLEYPFYQQDRAELEACRDALALLGGPFVCIQPGGRAPERRWQASRFARVADALARHGLRVALTGTEADRPVTQAVAARMYSQPMDLAGRLTSGAFALLLDYAYLLISNDTGVTRLAEAIGTPSVTIASGADVPLWRPADRSRYRVLWLPGIERPSVERLYSTWPDHATGISVEAVLDACDVLLAEPALKQRAAVRAQLARLRHEQHLARAGAGQTRRSGATVRRAS